MTPNSLRCLRLVAWPSVLLLGMGSLALLLWLFTPVVQAEEPALVPEAPGSISGVVSDAAGVAQANITLTLYQSAGPYPVGWAALRTVTTNASGAYRIGLLSAGIYRIGFTGPSDRFALNYYSGAATAQEGQDIVITGNNVTGINATLLAGARITGEIRLADSSALVNGGIPIFNYGDVRALRKVNGRWLLVKLFAFANEDRVIYNLDGLPPGVYRLCVSRTYYSYYQSYAECYDNIGSGIDNAADVTLAVGETKPNINFVLGDGADLARITGKVTGEDGAPVVNLSVSALMAQTYGFESRWDYVAVTQTNAAGEYRLIDLQPGHYTLLFNDFQGNYISEVYQDIPWSPFDSVISNATSFPLQRFEVRANVNATLTRASHLVGAITLREEGPPQNGEIQVYQERDGEWKIVRQGGADPRNGIFRIGGLSAGVYKVTAYANVFYSVPYAGYYGGNNLDEATPISLTYNTTRTNINIELTRITSGTIFAGEIGGVVTTTTGPLKDIQVTVYHGYCCHNQTPLVYAFTDANGRYRINGLVDGQYHVRFADPSGAYATIWHNNQRTPQNYQNTVDIFGGRVLTNVNASLVRGGGISGNVRQRDGTPLIDIQVLLYSYIDNSYIYPHLEEVVTDANGNYTLKGLHPGVYQICFVDPTYKYPTACYGAPPRITYPGLGINLHVEAGKTLTGIDQILGPMLSFYLPIIGR